MKTIQNICIILFSLLAVSAFAHINPELKSAPAPTIDTQSQQVSFREDCQPATSQIDMDINNVRARLLTGGDLWWDLNEGKYIVPAPPIGSGLDEVSSIYAGGVWIGGLDPAGNLKLAASTYRTSGNADFFAGPLDPSTGLTDLEICNQWDEFFVVEGTEVNASVLAYDEAIITGTNINCDSIPDAVKFWPGKDNPYFQEKYPFDLPAGQNLGSFWDEDLSGDYDPCRGDFPIIDIRGCEPNTRKEAIELIPDQMIFWIYNDAGAEHRLSRGAKIQMEVQVQAFAYATNDEVNDMTFYRYKLLNRAPEDIRECYFAMWVDPDLGCFTDDFVGCDVERSLAYTYNEDILDGTTGCACDGGVTTYCDRVPIIGTDYFRGPIGPFKIVDPLVGELHVVAKADDIEGAVGLDGELLMVGDTIYVQRIDIEETNEADLGIELGMSSFIYYNNGAVGSPDPNTTDPTSAAQYYNYLQGLWLNGTPLTQGGTGFNPGSVDEVKYVFPSDPNETDGWSMCTEDLGNGDRRTLQASGPLLLKPSVENELIVGAVWVPELQYPCPDISRLKRADDLAQALFDNCFDIIDGPTAPDVCPIALDREIILVLSNDTISSNNAFEAYTEKDIFAGDEVPEEDANYVFEGYKIFQLVNAGVSTQELDNIERARLVGQFDISNGISEIYNWNSVVDPNPAVGTLIWSPERVVDGQDSGIRHTFKIEEDAFAPGDSRLINHKQYHYMVLAYGYNNYETFDPIAGVGQSVPYLEGRKNVKIYTVVPRPIVYQQQKAKYGDGATITRVDGVGVGGNFLDMDESMYDIILSGAFDGRIKYKDGAGPINVNIYDPINVKDGKFTLELVGNHGGNQNCRLEDGATWVLTDTNSGAVITSESSIDILNEQLLPEYGFSLSVTQGNEPGTNIDENNGAIDIVSEYKDPTGSAWYGAIADDATNLDIPPFLSPIFNFLKTQSGEANNADDRNASFSSVGERSFYPFIITDGSVNELVPFYLTPAWQPSQGFVQNGVNLSSLNNVDIVFTNNKELWSKCVVIETAGPGYADVGESAVGGAGNLDLRESTSLNREGQTIDGTGMSYFPGYAIDVETGKRLNIFFGENSVFNENFAEYIDGGNPIGSDMMFNPSDQLGIDFPVPGGNVFDPRLYFAGGQHIIYVTRDEYDGCAKIHEQLSGSLVGKINAYKSVTWASMSLLPSGASMFSYADGAVPNELTIKLRVENGYGQEQLFNIEAPTGCNTTGGNPKYEFEISGREALDVTNETIENALSNVNIVPNPYYGYSAYEISQNSKSVKITNLPDRATVTIYSLDGKFIRQFRRDERVFVKSGSNPGVERSQTSPDLLWDLNNVTGIPVASGVYLVHITAEDFGVERTIKWFGVNRKFDASGL